MKKLSSVLVIFLFLSVAVNASGRFMVTVSGNYLVPADKNYKDIYGEGKFYPEIKAGYKVYGDFYIWAGYGYLSANGTTVSTLNLDAESTQKFLSFGAGYNKNISKTLGFKVEFGGFNVSYQEEAMEEKVTGSALGFRVDGGIIIDIGKTVFTDITVGYFKTSDTVDKHPIEFGGFKAGIGLGIKF